jgi:hypothetical protein
MPPFAADGSTSKDGEAERAWRQQLADAARRAADDLAQDHPSLRQLHTDLVDLAERMTAEDIEPPEADDPRRSTK